MEYSELKYDFPVKYAELESGAKVAYIDEGKGAKIILFLHGFAGNIMSWKQNIPVLSGLFRCVALDLPGFGKSGKSITSATVDYYADIIKDFLSYLGIQKAVFAGHSLGGQIAVKTAVKFPSTAEKIILAGSSGMEKFSDEEINLFLKMYTPEMFFSRPRKDISDNIKKNFDIFPDDAQFMIETKISLRRASDFYNYCTILSAIIREAMQNPVLGILGSLNQPVLMMYGGNDKQIPNKMIHQGSTEEIAKSAASKINNCKLMVIPDCGHFLQFEKAELFNSTVSEFILRD